MLTWAVALKHPRAFAAAFPVAGFLFPERLERTPADARAMPPIVAFHGGADPLVSADEDRLGARLLEKRGARVDLRVTPAVRHQMPPAMVGEIFASIARALPRRGSTGVATPATNAALMIKERDIPVRVRDLDEHGRPARHAGFPRRHRWYGRCNAARGERTSKTAHGSAL
jgi:hypothetical protein